MDYITVPGWLAFISEGFAWIPGVDPLTEGDMLARNDPNTWAVVDAFRAMGANDAANWIINTFGEAPVPISAPIPEAEPLPAVPGVIQPDAQPGTSVQKAVTLAIIALIGVKLLS